MKRKEFAIIACGLSFWLIACSLIFPKGGSNIWTSDLLSGMALAFFSLFSLRKNEMWPLWTLTMLGLWLQFAPLALWADQPWQYLNGTLCGFIAMALSLRTLYPKEVTGRPSAAPTGWSFNPSSWGPRMIMVFFALTCSFLAHYMAAYQLGYIPTIWDPIFKGGTFKVVTSAISKAFPVSDAGLGALAYALEALMGCQGDNQRWRTMPWATITFGLLAVPVSTVSILLIISQPVLVGAWCSWCLFTAFLMILMIPLAIPEFIATLRFLHEAYRKKKPLWHLFWRGEAVPGKVVTADFKRPKPLFPPAGVTLPWNLLASALLGVLAVFSVHLFPSSAFVADSFYVAGPLIYAVSIISMAEALRSARLVNIFLGLWLAVAPWLASEPAVSSLALQSLIGLVIALLSVRKGPIRERYGSWEKFIF